MSSGGNNDYKSGNMKPQQPIASTPTKEQQSPPAKFVKPADLFKMRRRNSNNNVSSNAFSTPTNQNSKIPALAATSSSNQMRSSPYDPQRSNSNSSPNPFKHSPMFHIEPQSPLKCLNNLADPSPTKKMPTLLKNPFNQPVKRRLNLGFSPNKNRLIRSPNKRMRMIELDEDANLEPPPQKININVRLNYSESKCYHNDWTLRTKLKINFDGSCKNWNESTTSTHKRCFNSIEESPSKLNDHTISIEAIRNATTVYQHPYLSWHPLYPRITLEFEKRRENTFNLTKDSQVTKMMHKDWCQSLDDLCNLLIDGKCEYFYMCSDNYNILFKQIPTSDRRKPLVQAFISPFSYGMGCELNKAGVQFRCPEVVSSNSTVNITSVLTTRDSSQSSFGSSQNTKQLDDDISQDMRRTQGKLAPSSVDSGNVSDLECDEDDFAKNDENDDCSQFLESIGLSQQDFPSLQTKRKGFFEADSNTQSKSTSNKPLASIEGTENIRKLVRFLQGNRLYTISNIGKFACIPPTLLSPTQFRLSTPQCPEVTLSKNVVEAVKPTSAIRNVIEHDKNLTESKSPMKHIMLTPTKAAKQGRTLHCGPTFVELKGTILPNLYKELHKLLIATDNKEHSCQSTILDSTVPLGTIQFNP